MNRLFRCFDTNQRLTVLMTRIAKFAVATTMRFDEICRAEWTDLDVDCRYILRLFAKSDLGAFGDLGHHRSDAVGHCDTFGSRNGVSEPGELRDLCMGDMDLVVIGCV